MYTRHYKSLCWSVPLSICLSVHLSVCLSVHLSLSIYPFMSVHPSILPSICLSVCLSVCLPGCPSVCLLVMHCKNTPKGDLTCIIAPVVFTALFFSTFNCCNYNLGVPVCDGKCFTLNVCESEASFGKNLNLVVPVLNTSTVIPCSGQMPHSPWDLF